MLTLKNSLIAYSLSFLFNAKKSKGVKNPTIRVCTSCGIGEKLKVSTFEAWRSQWLVKTSAMRFRKKTSKTTMVSMTTGFLAILLKDMVGVLGVDCVGAGCIFGSLIIFSTKYNIMLKTRLEATTP